MSATVRTPNIRGVSPQVAGSLSRRTDRRLEPKTVQGNQAAASPGDKPAPVPGRVANNGRPQPSGPPQSGSMKSDGPRAGWSPAGPTANGGLESSQAKRTLRTLYRAKRRALSTAQQHAHAEAVAQTLLPHLRGEDVVGVYLHRDGELNLAPTMSMCQRKGARLALPVVVEAGLVFAAYTSGQSMRRNRFGIEEPEDPVIAKPTLVLAPLVAFDLCGTRLGMGGGYYDRYFQEHPSARRIGVAHECQCVRELPAEPGDVPLAAAVTERGWRCFRR